MDGPLAGQERLKNTGRNPFRRAPRVYLRSLKFLKNLKAILRRP